MQRRRLVERLGDAVSFYKIGYQLAFAGGLGVRGNLMRADKQVFLDLKLHDIGNTFAKGVESVAAWARLSSPCMPIRRP